MSTQSTECGLAVAASGTLVSPLGANDRLRYPFEVTSTLAGVHRQATDHRQRQPAAPGEAVAEEARDSDLEFFDDFKVGDGQYQYKFRIGHGDWWVCDESVETGGFFSSPFH